MLVNFKVSFWCLQIDQKNNENFARISALAYKGLNQKRIKAVMTESV